MNLLSNHPFTFPSRGLTLVVFILGLLLGLIITSPHAAYANAFKQYPAWSSDFTWVRFDPVFRNPPRTEGRLWIKPPYPLKIKMTKPNPLAIWVEPTQVTIQTPTETRSLKLDPRSSDPQDSSIHPFALAMISQVSTLEPIALSPKQKNRLRDLLKQYSSFDTKANLPPLDQFQTLPTKDKNSLEVFITPEKPIWILWKDQVHSLNGFHIKQIKEVPKTQYSVFSPPKD